MINEEKNEVPPHKNAGGESDESLWRSMDSAPRDGTWFEAKSPLCKVPRTVHWADKYDRLPIGSSDGMWPCLPTQWRPLRE